MAINPYKKKCRVCGKEYKGKVWNQQTCSVTCSKKLKKGRVKQ
jgi:predicted nucleic acid-binding Zn ribbon protein